MTSWWDHRDILVFLRPGVFHRESANQAKARIVNTLSRFEFDNLSKGVIGCAVEVHRVLGPGFLETAYRNAMRIALEAGGFEFASESRIVVRYRGVEIGTHLLDLVVREQLIVELKAVKALSAIHFSQLRSYLRATDLRVGLLLNFNSPRLEIRRLVNRYQATIVSVAQEARNHFRPFAYFALSRLIPRYSRKVRAPYQNPKVISRATARRSRVLRG